jgi:hypothetical protein
MSSRIVAARSAAAPSQYRASSAAPTTGWCGRSRARPSNRWRSRAARAYSPRRATDRQRVLWDAIVIAFLVVTPFSYLHWWRYLLPRVPIVALQMTKPLSVESFVWCS